VCVLEGRECLALAGLLPLCEAAVLPCLLLMLCAACPRPCLLLMLCAACPRTCLQKLASGDPHQQQVIDRCAELEALCSEKLIKAAEWHVEQASGRRGGGGGERVF
jgi:hypothetical protein